jgi:hypothetical protein
MEAAILPTPRTDRGTHLIVAHCASVGRLTGPGGSSARRRLERALGNDLARLLVGALATVDPPRTPGDAFL